MATRCQICSGWDQSERGICDSCRAQGSSSSGFDLRDEIAMRALVELMSAAQQFGRPHFNASDACVDAFKIADEFIKARSQPTLADDEAER